MGAGRVLAIIGAIVGILSVLLSVFIPALFSWYRANSVVSGVDYHYYLTGFGGLRNNDPATYDRAMLVLIGGILILIGGGVCILSAIIKNKILGIIGGILMLVGPLLLFVEILSDVSDFANSVNNLVDASDKTIFFGRYTDPGGDFFIWGIWVGFYMAIGGGILGLIGGAIVER